MPARYGMILTVRKIVCSMKKIYFKKNILLIHSLAIIFALVAPYAYAPLKVSAADMVISSTVVTHPESSDLYPGEDDAVMALLVIHTTGADNPLHLTNLVPDLGDMTPTASASNTSAIQIFYTTTSTFDTNTQFSFDLSNLNGGGSESFDGDQVLQSGANYFWFVYDLNENLDCDNTMDISIFNYTIDYSYIFSDGVEFDGNPVGNRDITSYTNLTPANASSSPYQGVLLNWTRNPRYTGGFDVYLDGALKMNNIDQEYAYLPSYDSSGAHTFELRNSTNGISCDTRNITLGTRPFISQINTIVSLGDPLIPKKNTSTAFTLSVWGAGFTSSSKVWFNGVEKSITWNGATAGHSPNLQASILAADIPNTGYYSVYIINPTNQVSNPMIFAAHSAMLCKDTLGNLWKDTSNIPDCDETN